MKKKKDTQAAASGSEKDFVNPIDPDKVAEHPSLLPYAHTVGGAVIKPIDKGRVKGLAVEAMYEQTNSQLDQIREQVELLAQQAQAIHDRVRISEQIYLSEMNFKPLIGHVYHLYKKPEAEEEKWILSMIGPEEWGAKMPYEFIASAKLLADHTWEVFSFELLRD